MRDGSPAGRRISQVILESPARWRDMSIDVLAKACGANPSTVTRFCTGLGYRGYKEFQLDLAVAASQADSLELGDPFKGATPAAIRRAVFECSRRSLAETEKLLDDRVLEQVSELFRQSTVVYFLGIGASGHVARQASGRFMSLGLTAIAATDPYDQIFAMANARCSTVVVGISHTGQTAHVLDALRMARGKGARTVCITNYPDSPIAEASEWRLITAFREHRVNAAVSSSYIAQLCIIDTLYFLVASLLGKSARRLADVTEEVVQKTLRVKSRS